MSIRLDSAQLLSPGILLSEYPGHGVRGADVPSGGAHGPSPLFNDLALPGDADREYRWQVVTPPSVGALQVFENGAYEYTPPGGTTDLTVSFVYRLWQDGVDIGTATETIVIGAGNASGNLSGGVTLDPAVGGGTLGSQPSTPMLSGDATLDSAVPGGAVSSHPPGSLGGDVPLAPVELDGTLTGDVSGVLPPLLPGRRVIHAGRQVPQRLTHLDITEIDHLTADFSSVLPAAERLIQTEVVIEARVGDDPTPRPLAFGLPQIHGQLVRQRIHGNLGQQDVTYLVRVTGMSAGGQVALASAFIKVVRLA